MTKHGGRMYEKDFKVMKHLPDILPVYDKLSSQSFVGKDERKETKSRVSRR